MKEQFDSDAIAKLGWRQGAILGDKLAVSALHHAPARLHAEDDAWLIVTSHDCDVVNFSIDKEPIVEGWHRGSRPARVKDRRCFWIRGMGSSWAMATRRGVPKRSEESFSITSGSLGPIGPCDLQVRPLTLLIGRQGTGKSLLAQMLYFFRGLPSLVRFDRAARRLKENENEPRKIVRRIVDGLRSSSLQASAATHRCVFRSPSHHESDLIPS